MPVTEAYMNPGDFRLRLRPDAPTLIGPALQVADYSTVANVRGVVVPLGYIVITPQWIGNPAGYSVATLMSAARYTGVVLEPEWEDGILSVYGAGLDWLFGEESGGTGPQSSVLDLNTDTLSNVMSAVTSFTGLTVGTVSAGGSFTGRYERVPYKQVLLEAMAALDAHYRIQPDGTVDAEFVGDGTLFVETPTMVIAPDAGSDALYTGVPAELAMSRRSARDWRSGASVTNGATTQTAGAAEPQGLHGSVLRYNHDGEAGTDDSATIDSLADGRVRNYGIAAEHHLRLSQWQSPPVSGGNDTIWPGDRVYVWDPASGFIDTANGPIWFRGECIAPLSVRCVETEWPLVEGMGVYYRPPISSGSIAPTDIIDLTPYVEWEATGARAETLIRVDENTQAIAF